MLVDGKLLGTHVTTSVRSVCLQAKEILFTKRLLNRYMSEYTDQPVDKIEVRSQIN